MFASSVPTPGAYGLACASGCLVVLGCRVLPDGTPSPALARRLGRAADIHAEGHFRQLLVSGGRCWNGQREADVMRAELTRLGVSASHIISERESLNTRGNAAACTRQLMELNFDALGLVTCDFHMQRALAEFRRHGWQPLPLPVKGPSPVGVRGWLRQQLETLGQFSARLRIV